MLQKLAKGEVTMGRAGTEEALQGRYEVGTQSPTLVTAAELDLESPSSHGILGSQSWQQALCWYSSCARVGTLVLAGSASGFAEWVVEHAPTDMPDGRLYALMENRIVSVHTASQRGSHSVAEGNGSMIWPSGSYYSGGFKEDKRHGKGTHVLKNGEEYVGEWHGGKKNGKGAFKYANGNQYDGQWHNNERDGEGAMRYPDGNKYTGQWSGGKRHGQGTFTFGKTGVRFIGQWSDEQMHGAGKAYEQNGKTIDGTWKKGKKDGKFVTTWIGVEKVEKEVWVDGQLTAFEEGTRVLLAEELAAAGLEDAANPRTHDAAGAEDSMAA